MRLNNEDIWEIDRLTEANWQIWKFLMTNVLKAKNLWKYVGGIKSQDDETAEVCDVEDPAEVWKILNERFDSKSMGHVLNLNRRLFSFKMKTGITVQMIDSLSGENARVEESQQISVLLNSVSDTFSQAVTALSAREDKDLTMSLIQSTLLAEEERIEQKKLRTTNSPDYVGPDYEGHKGLVAIAVKYLLRNDNYICHNDIVADIDLTTLKCRTDISKEVIPCSVLREITAGF
ncbi:hypothetical protein GJ496_009240 [Pomphorhynchus laevis]|nr:hypothetical protein GJ496_009240 [Pomphorhynchus laevis]